VDEVIMGNVVTTGLGPIPARQAAIKAGVPFSAGATAVNKGCGSGLKAVMLAAQAIRLGEASVVVAGGMDNMSRAPDLLDDQKTMGSHGNRCAQKYGLTWEDQDQFAVRSFTRARQAIAEGTFKDEIVPVCVAGKNPVIVIHEDEGPGRFDEAKLRSLKPVRESGTVRAANASSPGDGAAALVLASEAVCKEGHEPVARVLGYCTFGREPECFMLAPIGAVRKLLGRLTWTIRDIDLFEIDETFSVVPLAATRELGVPPDKVNIYGGAIALGHPVGCSGARILVTLLTGLKRTRGKRGVACLCIGGGEALALAVEAV
jgi:acetyl-CoA C-acetyltransferase